MSRSKMYKNLVSQIFCCQADGSERPSKTQKVDTGVSKGDEAKLQFVMNGIAEECTFTKADHEISDDLRTALQYAASMSPDLLTQKREEMISKIEHFAVKAWSSGHVSRWMADCDVAVSRVCAGVNGPTLEALAKAVHHPDLECIDFFRRGAPFLGNLPFSANGARKTYDEHVPVEKLMTHARSMNLSMLKTLKEDVHADILMQQVCLSQHLHS